MLNIKLKSWHSYNNILHETICINLLHIFSLTERCFSVSVATNKRINAYQSKPTANLHELWLCHACMYIYAFCPARNVTDLLQVVDFTGLLQVVNKLQQVCYFDQVIYSKPVEILLVTT